MNIHNINTISRYETKLLRRSWLFRIFAVLSLLIIVFFQISLQSNIFGWYRWGMVAMPSSIPFVNIYLFNIAQSIIAIFLAGNFLKRDKKLDTAEPDEQRRLYCRQDMGDYQGFRVVEHYCINHRWFYTRFRERFPVRVPPLYFLFTYPVYPVTGIRARSFIRGHELCPQPSGNIYHHAGIHKRYIVVLGRSGARNV